MIKIKCIYLAISLYALSCEAQQDELDKDDRRELAIRMSECSSVLSVMAGVAAKINMPKRSEEWEYESKTYEVAAYFFFSSNGMEEQMIFPAIEAFGKDVGLSIASDFERALSTNDAPSEATQAFINECKSKHLPVAEYITKMGRDEAFK